MKLIIVVYEDGIDEDLTETMERFGVRGYTKLFGAQGVGHAGPKLGTPVWPGLNNVLYVALPDEQVAPMVDTLHALQSSYRKKPGIKVFSVPVEVFL